MCCGTIIGPSFQFTLEIPRETPLDKAVVLLRGQDEYNSRGQKFSNPNNYRQYECLYGSPITHSVEIRCYPSSEQLLRKVLLEFVVSQKA